MSKRTTYAPKHRAPGRHKAVRPASVKTLRTTVALTSVAAVTTGAAVSGGVLTGGDPAQDGGLVASASSVAGQALARRQDTALTSRSDRRGTTDAAKAETLSVDQGVAVNREQSLDDADPRDIARALLPVYGFDSSEFGCLDALYVSESNWRTDADNPTSSAYGIPQALTSMHELPADYMTSAESQIRWGLEYIRDAYGTPCSAWSFKQGNNWY